MDLSWLTSGTRLGLFDDLHTLVIVGVYDSYLTRRACIWNDGEPVSLDCDFGSAHDQGESLS